MRFFESVLLLFASRISVVAVNFLLIPLYLAYMDQAVVGLMTLLISVLAATAMFDFGISTKATVSAAAFQSNGSDKSSSAMLRYAELAYWIIGAAIALAASVFFILVPGSWIWLLLKENTTTSLAIGSACLIVSQIFFGWLQNYYVAVLTGLQATRKVCISQIILSVLRLLSIAACLKLTSSLFMVLLSHVLCTLAQVVYCRFLFDKHVAKLDLRLSLFNVYQKIEKTANKDLAIIGAAAIFLTYADKIWLSLISSPEQYATYSVAAMLASGLYLFISPIYTSLVPHFVKVLAHSDEKLLKAEYKLASDLIAFLLVPSAMVLIYFSNDILKLWLRNSQVAAQAATVLPWLVLGVLANAFLIVAYALQIAAGWTKLAKQVNVVMSVILLPSLWLSYTAFGLKGAAINWALMNMALLCIWPAFMHIRLIPRFMPYWLSRHVLLPCLVVAFVVACGAALLKRIELSDIQLILVITLIYGIACFVVLLCSSSLKQRVWNKIDTLFNH